jgi:hypothetical protein
MERMRFIMRMIHWLRRPRWSLRSFLIAVLLLGAISAWSGRQLVHSPSREVRLSRPITAGKDSAVDPPSKAEIIEKLEELHASDDNATDFRIWSIVYYWQEHHLGVRREMPLIGPVVHHQDISHYLVFGTNGWFPALELVIVDHSHLHMVP